MPVSPSAVHVVSFALSAAVLLTAAPAAAWTEPERISAPRTAIHGLRLTAAADGTTVAGWTFQRGRGNGSVNGVELAARRHRAWGPVRSLARAVTPRDAFMADLDFYGHARLTALTQRDSVRENRLEVRFGRAAGSMGPVRPLAVGQRISSPELAASPDGAAIAAWTQEDARRGSRARVAARSAGGDFNPGVPLSRTGASSTDVALDGRTAFVAWLRAGRV